MIEIPEISKEGLRYLSVCIHVDLPSASAPSTDVEIQAKVGDDVYFRKVVETFEEHCHFHVEVGIKRELQRLGRLVKSPKVLSIPPELHGKAGWATIWGRFRITRSKLPEDSFIRALSGVVIPARDYELHISGCTLDVSGDGPIIELRWTCVSKDAAKLDLGAYAELTIDDQFLVNAVPILNDGLQQLVLRKKPLKKAPKKGTSRGKRKPPA